jgi:hypothetical protein
VGTTESFLPEIWSALALVGPSARAVAAFLSGLFAGAVINQWLDYRRERRWFRIASFERFRKELTQDPNLRRIELMISKEADAEGRGALVTTDEIHEYAGFFEEIGIYFKRDLVDIVLVDEIMGDEILSLYTYILDSGFLAEVREEDPTEGYYDNLEALAKRARATPAKARSKTMRCPRDAGTADEA